MHKAQYYIRVPVLCRSMKEIPSIRTLAVYSGLIVVGAGVGAGTGFFAASPSSGQSAGQSVVSALEAQTGQSLELLQVANEQGMYRVDVRSPNDQVQTYYASPTGELFFSETSGTSPETLTQVVNQRQQLGDCLRRKDATLYGNISQRATQLQVQALGQRNIAAVYADVNNQSVLQMAAQQGVERTPAFVYNGTSLPGVNSPSRVSSFTGCEFNATQ